MADEPNPTSSTPTEQLGNSPETRNPDGTIKDPAAATTESTLTSTTSTDSTKTTEPPKATEPPKGAPEAYAEFKAPEGYEVDKKAIDGAVPIFKELGLSQDQAQKLVDFYSTISKDAAEAPMAAYREMRQGWRAEVAKSDLGNGIDNLKPEVAAAVSSAIDAMPNPAEFRAVLDLSGLGDNPAFIRGFYSLAKERGEGTGVRGSGPSPLGQQARNAPRSAAQALYPNLPSAS